MNPRRDPEQADWKLEQEFQEVPSDQVVGSTLEERTVLVLNWVLREFVEEKEQEKQTKQRLGTPTQNQIPLQQTRSVTVEGEVARVV